MSNSNHPKLGATQPPLEPMSARRQQEWALHCGSQAAVERRALGFAPAFLDLETGVVYPARFADGRPAPMHLLDGLPNELVEWEQGSAAPRLLKPTLVAGFWGRRKFFTRDQAARALRLAARIRACRSDARQ